MLWFRLVSIMALWRFITKQVQQSFLGVLGSSARVWMVNEWQHVFMCSLVLDKQIHNWIARHSVKAGLVFWVSFSRKNQPCALREKLCGSSVQLFSTSILTSVVQARKNSRWEIPCKSGSYGARSWWQWATGICTFCVHGVIQTSK